MSGLEVIGGISAVISIIDASIKIYNSARKDLTLSETFKAVGQRLPIILDTLQTCKNHLEPVQGSMPADTCEALEKILDGCDEKAGKLREIFEKVIPGENDAWEKRYLKVFKRLGKGNKVEELMISITEDVQLVVNNHAVKSATPERNAELENIIKEMKSIKPSVPEDGSLGTTFNSGGGEMHNYLNQDKGYLVVNHEKIQNQNFGKN
jgi:N-terminal domain on NACHT_NTPase and P-loop NTPases